MPQLNPSEMQGELPADLFEQLDWSRAPVIVSAVIAEQHRSVQDRLVAGAETGPNGGPIIDIEWTPFDAGGWTLVGTPELGPFARIHYTRLMPDAPLRLDMKPIGEVDG